MTREEIERFFDGCIVNGISREVVFPELQEEGRIEVELIAPPGRLQWTPSISVFLPTKRLEA